MSISTNKASTTAAAVSTPLATPTSQAKRSTSMILPEAYDERAMPALKLARSSRRARRLGRVLLAMLSVRFLCSRRRFVQRSPLKRRVCFVSGRSCSTHWRHRATHAETPSRPCQSGGRCKRFGHRSCTTKVPMGYDNNSSLAGGDVTGSVRKV